jgi:hypothetical protein
MSAYVLAFSASSRSRAAWRALRCLKRVRMLSTAAGVPPQPGPLAAGVDSRLYVGRGQCSAEALYTSEYPRGWF